ncbi:hypothetical protein [uncultured Ruminococcus sp.]|nr:hypothetical protein [uncultured Ruminococcus sp.]
MIGVQVFPIGGELLHELQRLPFLLVRHEPVADQQLDLLAGQIAEG